MPAKTQNVFADLDSSEFFSMNWKLWKCVGIIWPGKTAKQPRCSMRLKHLMWNYFINITVTCMFPLHLFLAIFNPVATTAELFDSVTIFITSLGGATKLMLFNFNIKNIKKMEKILRTLEKRIEQPADRLCFREQVKRTLVFMDRMYLVIYAGVGVFATLAFMVRGEQKLIYPGWLPFDWKQSSRHFFAAVCFQIYGIVFQIMHNLVCDSFSPKALRVLAGHIEFLYSRVARIGYDASLKLADNETELHKCVLHQQDVYALFATIQTVISWPIFFQQFASLVNIGVVMVMLIFFVTDIFQRIYYMVYFVAITLQLLPVCYFGSVFVILFERLHYAVFSCNWIGQTKGFKRHMMLFTERSLKITIARAGGMFPIHLTAFFATCKGAYSIFTLLISMK